MPLLRPASFSSPPTVVAHTLGTSCGRTLRRRSTCVFLSPARAAVPPAVPPRFLFLPPAIGFFAAAPLFPCAWSPGRKGPSCSLRPDRAAVPPLPRHLHEAHHFLCGELRFATPVCVWPPRFPSSPPRSESPAGQISVCPSNPRFLRPIGPALSRRLRRCHRGFL